MQEKRTVQAEELVQSVEVTLPQLIEGDVNKILVDLTNELVWDGVELSNREIAYALVHLGLMAFVPANPATPLPPKIRILDGLVDEIVRTMVMPKLPADLLTLFQHMNPKGYINFVAMGSPEHPRSINLGSLYTFVVS